MGDRQRCRQHWLAQSPRALRTQAQPAQMEPRSRRRRSRQLVATFLRDPGSGRVYRRGKLIGKGAFSRCYKLTDMSTSAVFALKVVPRGGAGRLRLRGKVPLQSLAHVLKVRRTLTEPEVRYYLRGLVSGLRYLHQQRIVHRDLKPSNFFLNKNMEVKIGDLGLAARVGPAGRCHRVLCGTPNFQAPEVVSRNGHSCKSDIWALGCIMYTVLTGTPPFAAAPLSEMYQNIRDGHYLEPTHLSPSARSLIARLLAPDPAERPSLDHLLQDDFFSQVVPEGGPAPADPVPATLSLYLKRGLRPWRRGHRTRPHGSRQRAGQDPPGEQRPVLWAPKWVDYSLKYGFGYQLSDGGSGVLFRDGSHMALRPQGGHVSYQPDQGTLWTFTLRDVPSPLRAKLAVLRLFACYMQRRLREEGTVPMPATPAPPDISLLSFIADSQAMVMLFSNGTVQVSLKTSQTQLVLSGEDEDLLLTLQEPGGPAVGVSYTLDVLRSHGFTLAVHHHLRHGLHLLQSV